MEHQKLDKELDYFYNLWIDADEASVKIEGRKHEFKNLQSKITKTGEKIDFIPGEFAILEPNFMLPLKPGERDIIVTIISELKKNNPFWYCNYREIGGKHERNILSLRKKGILIKTSNTDIHIVNPWLIRRGAIQKLIPAIVVLLEESKVLDKKIIKDLIPPDKSQLDLFFQFRTSKMKI